MTKLSGKLLRSAMLQTLSREDMLSLQGMVLLFHLQSDRDSALIPKEGYDILRDSILYDLFGYLDMKGIRIHWITDTLR